MSIIIQVVNVMTMHSNVFNHSIIYYHHKHNAIAITHLTLRFNLHADNVLQLFQWRMRLFLG